MGIVGLSCNGSGKDGLQVLRRRYTWFIFFAISNGITGFAYVCVANPHNAAQLERKTLVHLLASRLCLRVFVSGTRTAKSCFPKEQVGGV